MEHGTGLMDLTLVDSPVTCQEFSYLPCVTLPARVAGVDGQRHGPNMTHNSSAPFISDKTPFLGPYNPDLLSTQSNDSVPSRSEGKLSLMPHGQNKSAESFPGPIVMMDVNNMPNNKFSIKADLDKELMNNASRVPMKEPQATESTVVFTSTVALPVMTDMMKEMLTTTSRSIEKIIPIRDSNKTSDVNIDSMKVKEEPENTSKPGLHFFPGPVPFDKLPPKYGQTPNVTEEMEMPPPFIPLPTPGTRFPSHNMGSKPVPEVDDHEFPGESPGQTAVWVHPNQVHQQSEIPGKQNPDMFNTQMPPFLGPISPHVIPVPISPTEPMTGVHPQQKGPPVPGPGSIRPAWQEPGRDQPISGQGRPPPGVPFQGPVRHPGQRPEIHTIHIPNHPTGHREQIQDPHLQQLLHHLEQQGIIQPQQGRPTSPNVRRPENLPDRPQYGIHPGQPGEQKPGREPTEQEIIAELQAQGLIPPHLQQGAAPPHLHQQAFGPYPRPPERNPDGPPREFLPGHGQPYEPPGRGKYPAVKTEAELVAHLQHLGLLPQHFNPNHVPAPPPSPPHGPLQKQHAGFSSQPPRFPTHGGAQPDDVTVQTLEPLDEHTIRLVFSVPPVLVGLHGRIELRYSADVKNMNEESWEQQVLAPPDDLIATQQLEFELGGLQPDTLYKIKIRVLLRDLHNSPTSPILTVRTLPITTPSTTLPPQIAVDASLDLAQVNATWATLRWRKFTESEMQFIDGVQLRYKELDGKLYAATPFVHRAVTTYTLEGLKPDTIYEVAMFFIPFPGQTTELKDEKVVQIHTAQVQDIYGFSVEVVVHHIKSSSVEISWSGVPYPEDKYVNIFRAIYQSESGKEDLSTFKVAKRETQPKAMITDLKPGTRYRLWLEVYLTNGRIKKSNVQDFITKPGSDASSSQQGKLERAEPTLEAGNYYGPLVAVAILAALAIVAALILLLILIRKYGQNKATISAHPRPAHQAAYDNPSYKVEIQQETMDL